jgi:multicomponent Na+:H+ antiporter subunit D
LLQGEPAGAYFVLACGTIAIIEATLRVVSQRDLKRIVALTTVIEMNWLAICIGLGGALFDQIGAFLLVAHSLTTAGEFYSVECVYRRFGSRDLGVVSGVAFAAPLLFGCLFLTTLVTIGFPASSLFAAKLLFLTGLAQLSLGLCVFYTFWFVLVLPVAFLRVWLPVWFGQPQAAYRVFDLTGRELSLLSLTLAGGVALGLQPTLVLGF